MLNLDQFKAVGIASTADVETLDTYEDNLPYYQENAYTYIPIPTADQYYHVVDDELLDLDEDQYFHPDITMITAFERLQNYPFLILDSYMTFQEAPENADREYVPAGEKEYEIHGDSYTFSELVEQADDLLAAMDEDDSQRMMIEVAKNAAKYRYSIITLADANKRRARELFYHAISEFEIQLANLVKAEYPNSLIDDVDEEEIERWYRAKIDQLEIHIAEHMHLSTLLTVGAKTENIREQVGYSSRNQFDNNLRGLNYLRHKVLHPTRGLVHDQEDLENEVDRLNRVSTALEELNADEIQPDYPLATELAAESDG